MPVIGFRIKTRFVLYALVLCIVGYPLVSYSSRGKDTKSATITISVEVVRDPILIDIFDPPVAQKQRQKSSIFYLRRVEAIPSTWNRLGALYYQEGKKGGDKSQGDKSQGDKSQGGLYQTDVLISAGTSGLLEISPKSQEYDKKEDVFLLRPKVGSQKGLKPLECRVAIAPIENPSHALFSKERLFPLTHSELKSKKGVYRLYLWILSPIEKWEKVIDQYEIGVKILRRGE